jgi:hypothetical protein
MDKAPIKKDIAALIKTINEQFAAIEHIETCSQQQTELLIHNVEQLHKKAVLFEYLNASAAIKKEELSSLIISIEKPVISELPVIEKIIPKEIRTPEIKPPENFVNTAAPLIKEILNKEVIANNTKSTQTRNIKTAIGINDKFEFINELFNGSSTDYEAHLQVLNNAASSEHALEIITDLQKRYNWQDDNETVSRFIELIKTTIH